MFLPLCEFAVLRCAHSTRLQEISRLKFFFFPVKTKALLIFSKQSKLKWLLFSNAAELYVHWNRKGWPRNSHSKDSSPINDPHPGLWTISHTLRSQWESGCRKWKQDKLYVGAWGCACAYGYPMSRLISNRERKEGHTFLDSWLRLRAAFSPGEWCVWEKETESYLRQGLNHCVQ